MIAIPKAGSVIESTYSNRRYQIVRQLGRGGFGAAFEVVELGPRDRKLQSWCLKVTDDQGSWHREAYFGELLCGHDRAIQLEETFAVSRRRRHGRSADYYIVTEFADNGDIDSYLSRSDWKPWPATRVRREAIALLRLFTILHGGGMTHRDLTPANIFVTARGRLKVGDWGIARTSVGGVLAELDGENWLFTPAGFRGRARDDTWMLGQLMAMLLSADTDAPWRPQDVVTRQWDDDLTRVICRAIGPATKRYADAYEMLADLDEHARRALPVRSLRGKTVCFTGALNNATRQQARRELDRAGATYHDDVGSGTDVLVRGERSPLYSHGTHGQKLVRAEQYGTKVITETEFWRVLASAP